MVTAEFIQSVVRVKCGFWVGTGFITNQANHTLLVTARHIVADDQASIEDRPVEIYRGDRFEMLDYKLALDNATNVSSR
jgi:hypothetical protein